MMNKRWTALFFGQVHIEVTGQNTERFINRCMENNISVTNIRRTNGNSIACTVQAEDVRKLRPLLRQSDCKLHILKKDGLPFFFKKILSKKGFLSGLLLFVVILFVLSNMLWRIDVIGATPKIEHDIRQVLEDIGVEPGAFQFKLPPPEDIQYAISDRVNKVAWVGASLNGTTYTFRVVEKEIPEEQKALTPRNLVADKEAVIHDIYVEQGKALVKENDYVQKGDVLIAGTIGDEDHKKVVPAKGKVRGETWYESRVTVPLETRLETNTGESYTKHTLAFFGVRIPFWGFSGPDFHQYRVKTKEIPLRIFGWTLPITYETTTYLESEQVKRTYSRKEAIQKAKQLGRKALKKKLSKDDHIRSEKILRRSRERGKVKVLIHYTVIEHITKEQPLLENKETE